MAADYGNANRARVAALVNAARQYRAAARRTDLREAVRVCLQDQAADALSDARMVRGLALAHRNP